MGSETDSRERRRVGAWKDADRRAHTRRHARTHAAGHTAELSGREWLRRRGAEGWIPLRRCRSCLVVICWVNCRRLGEDKDVDEKEVEEVAAVVAAEQLEEDRRGRPMTGMRSLGLCCGCVLRGRRVSAAGA